MGRSGQPVQKDGGLGDMARTITLPPQIKVSEQEYNINRLEQDTDQFLKNKTELENTDNIQRAYKLIRQDEKIKKRMMHGGVI